MSSSRFIFRSGSTVLAAISFILLVIPVLGGCDQSEPESAASVVTAVPPVPSSAEVSGPVPTGESVNAQTRLLVVGDSLSAAYNMPVDEGWVARLQRRLDEQGISLDVINASISGDTTRGALSRLSPLLEQYHPQVVMIELGGNDGLRGLSAGQMQQNLAAMIEQAQAADAEVILVAVRIPLNYGPQYRQEFEQVYTELAREYAVKVVPFPLEDIVTEPGYLQADGVHPTAAAQPLILDVFWDSILATFNAVSQGEE